MWLCLTLLWLISKSSEKASCGQSASLTEEAGMKRTRFAWRFLAPFLVLVSSARTQTPAPHPTSDLGGNSWQLVRFQGRDGTTLRPKDKTRYILAFATDGSLDVRIDCNRGRGTWKSAAASQLELSPLALTRAMCPPAPLNDRLPKDWQSIRSYVIKDGHLFLTAGGGIYEFEPRGAEGATPGAPAISGLPATFVGVLPCADCPGIRYQVNLLADHTFVSRMSYQGRPERQDNHGSWELSGDGKTLVLHGGGHGAPQTFAVRDRNTLRKLDIEGREIESKLNYDLKRAATFTPIEARGESATNATLENTDWRLTLLGDSPVHASPQKGPHFVLDSKTKNVSGSGGCNRLAGSYTLDGDHLAFHQTVSTMMACLQGMDTEKTFLQALSQVDSWKINGRRLDLFDKAGKRMAVFEAGNTK